MMTWRHLSLLGVSLLALTSCEDKTASLKIDPRIPVHSYGAGVGGGSLGMYTVRQGETVWMISQRYNLALRDILDANGLVPPFNLSNGQRLNLPAPQTYTVKPNDSLYVISRLFNTSTTELAKLNKLQPPYKLNGGEVLRLPPQYKPAPVVAQQVVYQVPPADLPPPVRQDRIETAPLPPVAQSQQGGYVPPPSTADEYNDDPRPSAAEPKAEVKQASVPAQSKIITQTPKREGKFIKPAAGKIISNYGLKKDGLHNDGINIQAAKGDPVRATESGVIVYTGNQIAGYGNLILIRHADQYVSAYAHLDKTLVKKGDTVKRGQTIGTVGSSGSVDKPQLHFEIRKGTKALDPAGLVAL